ncbi:MAG: DUF3987 domain-containing protein [bacterium]|nr:DUF3987 domain-containing protein [Candidatus Minthenecus merdequi]
MKEEALQFPIELFPKAFQEIARDCETSGGFPVSFTASSMLLAVATAIGNSRSLSCPIGIASTCSLFMALLGGPGAVKTPSMAFAMQPLRERDNETLTEYASLLKEYRASLRSGEQVEKPTPRQLITDDITIESLALVLTNNPNGVCVYNDELNGWFASFDKYRKGGGDVNRWLSLYSGQSYTINRKSTDDVIHVKHPFVCVLGSIQPEVLIRTFSGEMKENGMFQRILFVPNSSEDKPLIWSGNDDLPSTRDTDWKRFISRVLGYAEEYREYKFDKDAWAYLCSWQNSKEEELNADGDTSRVEIFRKSQIYAIRFCILFKVIHEIAEGKEPTDIVENIDSFRATELANYFFQASCCTFDYVTSGGYDDGASRFLLLYDQLPEMFTSQMALSLADVMRIPRSTLFYNLKKTVERKWVRQTGHGKYVKL